MLYVITNSNSCCVGIDMHRIHICIYILRVTSVKGVLILRAKYAVNPNDVKTKNKIFPSNNTNTKMKYFLFFLLITVSYLIMSIIIIKNKHNFNGVETNKCTEM